MLYKQLKSTVSDIGAFPSRHSIQGNYFSRTYARKLLLQKKDRFIRVSAQSPGIVVTLSRRRHCYHAVTAVCWGNAVHGHNCSADLQSWADWNKLEEMSVDLIDVSRAYRCRITPDVNIVGSQWRLLLWTVRATWRRGARERRPRWRQLAVYVQPRVCPVKQPHCRHTTTPPCVMRAPTLSVYVSSSNI